MHLILLHGAVSSARQFDTLSEILSKQHTVHPINFYGHGGSPLPDVFSIDLFAQQVIDYVNRYLLNEDVHVFGYSMGGYVAMYAAGKYSGTINKIITLATKFHWDVQGAEKEAMMLQPEKIEAKIPAWAGQLAQIHYPRDWKIVLNKTAHMLRAMGTNNPLGQSDYSSLQNQTLLLLGDRDKMVSLIETEAVFKQLPNGQLGLLPGTPHPFEQVDVHLLAFLINRFLHS